MQHAGFTILLVDDEPDAREILSLALGMEGYLVVQAANGQEALNWLKINRLPSVVVLDLAMPILDGPGFLAQRAQDPILAAIPVIVVSGSKPDNEILTMVEESLPKPVELTRLLKALSEVKVKAS